MCEMFDPDGIWTLFLFTVLACFTMFQSVCACEFASLLCVLLVSLVRSVCTCGQVCLASKYFLTSIPE